MFHYANGTLQCEAVSVRDIAERVGTPLYIYSAEVLRKQCRDLLQAFPKPLSQIHYAVKANSNLTLLKEIFQMGIGADVVSVGELEKALIAGCPPSSIIFSGVGKREDEIERAIDVGILALHIESIEELELLGFLSKRSSKSICIGFRINFDFETHTHQHIATGSYDNKFGLPETDVERAIGILKKHPNLRLIGLACHLGSQIFDLHLFEKAAEALVNLSKRSDLKSFPLEYLDMGGGLGVPYQSETAIPLDRYAKRLKEIIGSRGLAIALEPGRFLVASCGILVTRLLRQKSTPRKNFAVVDAAMNDLIRPVLYSAYHGISTVDEKKTQNRILTDIVGPICETADVLGVARDLPELTSKDLLFIENCGAYGISMASNYNLRPQAAEVLVDRNRWFPIRKRQDVSLLWKDEIFCKE